MAGAALARASPRAAPHPLRCASGHVLEPAADNPNTTTDAANRSYAVPTYEALRSSSGLDDASAGYAGGASDGLTMLDAAHGLSPYGSAPNGHVTLTARVPLHHRHNFTLALGF